MSEYLSKKAVLEWLTEQYFHGMGEEVWNTAISKLQEKIESGAFDAPEMEHINAYWAREGLIKRQQEEVQRLRAALEEVHEELETLHFMINQDDDIFHERKKKYLSIIDYVGQSVAGQALSTTTEPTGARREICPDHPDEKPQISSSHTWTQDGNTYFVSYVEYCPTCYHVISTSARL